MSRERKGVLTASNAVQDKIPESRIAVFILRRGRRKGVIDRQIECVPLTSADVFHFIFQSSSLRYSDSSYIIRFFEYVPTDK